MTPRAKAGSTMTGHHRPQTAEPKSLLVKRLHGFDSIVLIGVIAKPN